MMELAHRVKQLVIRQRWLRGALRRLVVTPFQSWQLRRLVERLPVEASGGTGPVVLVLALRHWAISRAWEAVMSRLLLQEGCRVVWLECDQYLPRCDSMLGPAPEPTLCRHCQAYNRRIDEVVGVERVLLGEVAPRSAEAYVSSRDRRRPAPIDPAALKQVRPSFQRLLGRAMPPVEEQTPAERDILDDLLESAALMARAAGPLLDRVRPAAVVALNGKFFAEAIVLAEAARRGLATWTYERGNRRDTLVLSPRPVAIPFDTAALLEGLADRPLSGAEASRLDAYLGSRAEVGNGQVRFLARSAAHLPTTWTLGQRRLALFTNLVWDSAVVGEDTVFDGMFHWLCETIRAVGRQPETQLVVRVHPAEEKVYWHPTRDKVVEVLAAAFPAGLPANVTLVGPLEPVDSYALVRDSHLVLVYASSVGMEAAALGKRVVVSANCSFASAPFVVRARSVAHYLEELARHEEGPPVPGGVELARRFLYQLYFETMLPVPAVREDPTGFHVEGGDALEGGPLRERLRELARGAAGPGPGPTSP